jgi:hypothetical protein
MFQKGILRKMSGHKKDQATGHWRQLHEEINNLYSSKNIFIGPMDKSRKMRGQALGTS